ncbi:MULTISPECIES: acetoacetate decarboxylase (ADC) [unclassified Pseudomonas]|uniref:acetoacetate decarboxylase (ADC) n=1 Tax=unclassified Pseudomonas TaxID=196821 RepID=UPI00244D03D3|nr:MULTISPECIES: acetoacetate decarboxylase (ADC) [unclassified Pseudomonas]MDH0893278.1 acetoacetate decarboxylase (ADC) [Pseudomonas sp. GD03875]MDH1064216.1 acetoacetate decarboxylase (ADC) [Pseudomonas sp. GD03985]
MKLGNIAVITGVLLSAVAASSWAEGSLDAAQLDGRTNLGGRDVSVVAGGLYDRYESNPPLSVIAAEAPDIDLSWFRELKKTKVDMGFESYSPNFYYKNNRVTAVFTADIDRLRELMPAEVLEQVQPLQVWPGRGLVAFTAYAYEYCDNDSYNEIALSIVTNKPGNSNLGPVTLVGQAMSKDFWGYVLKLPVNTELAEVRGVVGYNLPKWLTEINYRETDKSVVFEIIDKETGKVDVTFEGEKLDDLSDEIEMVTNSFTNIGHDGELAYGYAISRQQSHASSSSEEAVKLTLNDGSLSAYIESLGLGKMMKYEYVPEFQSALYSPEPLKAMLERD